MARFFVGSGGRKGKEVSVATRVIRDTIRKGGRINEDTFKKIVQLKLAEARAKKASVSFGMINNKKRSQSAQKTVALVQKISEEKAARRANKEVIIEVRRFYNGKIDEKGRIYDVACNIVARINKKNGVMTTISGDYVGVYKSKSGDTVNLIQNVIDKYSPYLIAQRKAVEMEKQRENDAANQKNGVSLDIWSRTPTDIWGKAKTDVWGRPATDIWGRSQADSWGNQQVDMWGNQI